jgi:hypothetical protein
LRVIAPRPPAVEPLGQAGGGGPLHALPCRTFSTAHRCYIIWQPIHGAMIYVTHVCHLQARTVDTVSTRCRRLDSRRGKQRPRQVLPVRRRA